MWDIIQPLLVSLLFLADVCVVVACVVVHFRSDFILFGGLSLVIFLLGGLITNWYNYYRHERHRMKQRSTGKKLLTIALIIIPGLSLISWLWKWLCNPKSWTDNYWVWTLRLFYTTTGSLTQAFLQTYLIIHLWWEIDVDGDLYWVLGVAAAVLALDAVVSVVGSIWKEHFEEKHETLPVFYLFLIFLSISFNMCGRIVLMAVVAAANEWWLLAAALATPFLINYCMCYSTYSKDEAKSKCSYHFSHCLFPLPIALLYAVTVSQTKVITVITTLSWICYSVPQIYNHHESAFQWIIWIIPVVLQFVALVLILIKWTIFKHAFHRFTRQLKSTEEPEKRKKPESNNKG